MLENILKHLIVINKHRWNVFKLCFKVGIPWRGFLHDLSKFSPSEFFESVKYYQGNKSPIPIARKTKGYSSAWLHHKGRNKHHLEYWVDPRCKSYAIVVPYKYAAEMACDKMAASIVYNGKNWTTRSEYDYWMKEKQISIVHPKIDNFLTEIFRQVIDQGINKVYTKKNFKSLYKKYCIDDKTEYTYIVDQKWKKEGE